MANGKLGGLLSFLPQPYKPDNQGMQTYQNEGAPMHTYDYNYPEMSDDQLYNLRGESLESGQQGIGMPLYQDPWMDYDQRNLSRTEWDDPMSTSAWPNYRNTQMLPHPGYTTYSGGELGHLPMASKDFEGMPMYKPNESGEMRNVSTFPYEGY